MRIEGRYGNWYDEVRVDGKVLDPARSQRVMNHSPDGFAWGYGGSGPAQLALAILLEAGISALHAIRLHHRFKAQIIQALPQRNDWAIELDVRAWAREIDGVQADDKGPEPMAGQIDY